MCITTQMAEYRSDSTTYVFPVDHDEFISLFEPGASDQVRGQGSESLAGWCSSTARGLPPPTLPGVGSGEAGPRVRRRPWPALVLKPPGTGSRQQQRQLEAPDLSMLVPDAPCRGNPPDRLRLLRYKRTRNTKSWYLNVWVHFDTRGRVRTARSCAPASWAAGPGICWSECGRAAAWALQRHSEREQRQQETGDADGAGAQAQAGRAPGRDTPP